MRYILLIYNDEKLIEDAKPEDWQALMVAHQNWGAEAESRGMKPTGDALHPTATSKTVRFENNQATITTDGPFAETKEQLGGFYILDCESEAEALEMAAKLPVGIGCVEVRPVVEF
ncbi:YciI family protein [Candidatus Leptofilum sp.]|uniref:YciI family protein n=1 Tax=Candidatus Leptofilum sp. TaxID=3241576 RepID=UPI003B593AB3